MPILPFKARARFEMKKRINPSEIPLYNASQVARFVGVPRSTLHKWLYGRDYTATGIIKHSDPLITPADEERGLLSFANLLEVHILDATRKARIPMADVREAINMVLAEDPTPHPLITGKFYKRGKKIFVESILSNEKIAASKPIQGQRPLGELLDFYLERIKRNPSGDPIELVPIRNNRNQSVVLNFEIAAGRPVINGTGVLVEVLRDLHDVGMSYRKIAQQYALRETQVVEAIRFIAA